MTNKWKDRVIRGGTIAMATVSVLGCVTALIAVTVGSAAAGRASVIILAVAAGIGLACVIAVSFPSLHSGRRRRRQARHCP